MDPSEDTAVQDFLEILEEHRKNCERQGELAPATAATSASDDDDDIHVCIILHSHVAE
jgi:hypothetical protein